MNDPVNKYDHTGNSWESFWSNIEEWFSEVFGFGISYENTSILPGQYFFWFEMSSGEGSSSSDNRPINLFVNIPENPWEVWNYSAGIDFHRSGNGFQVFIGTDVGVGWYNESNGKSISFDGSGRLKIAITQNKPKPDEDSYTINSFNFNIHNIVGTILIAKYAPCLIPALMNLVGKLTYC